MATVLDLTRLSAVYATRLLMEVGHSVVRIEPREGDEIRRMGPFLAEPSLELGAYHQFYNAGKRSLTLNFDSAAGRQVLCRLIRAADVLIASLPLPISEDLIHRVNPRLVLVVVEDDEPELCAFARSGLLSITGHPGAEPVALGAHIAYAATGLYVGVAASAALLAADLGARTGTVTVSVAQCLETWMEQPMVTYLTTGVVSARRGYRGAITAVSGAFECRDGFWMVSVPHGVDGWDRFMSLVQDPVLAEDPSLSDERVRLKRRDFILDRISEWSREQGRDEIVAEAQRRRVPASPVATPLDLVGDPQLVERGFLQKTDHPLIGSMWFPQGALGTLTNRKIAPAPRLGEHNAAILSELGYTAEDQLALLESGVL